MRGRRIGEADKPGPEPTPLKLLTANLGSWGTMAPWVATLPDDVLLLQETRITDAGLPAAKATAAADGWHGAWSPAQPNAAGPASGGLAVLARGGRRVAAIPHAGAHRDRWLHTAVERSKGQVLHVVSLYGWDAGTPGAAAKNAALFREVFAEMAALGAAPWVIGGDWNVQAQDVWDVVADDGRHHFLPRPSGDTSGGTCAPAGRRIDFFVAGTALAGRVSMEKIVADPSLHPHQPVRLQVACGGPPADIPVLDTPAAFVDADGGGLQRPLPAGDGPWRVMAPEWQATVAELPRPPSMTVASH